MIDLRFSHPANDDVPMVVTEFGIVRSVRLEQLKYAELLIVVILRGISILRRLEHPSNIPTGIEVREWGIFIVVSALQPMNRFCPMSLRLSGRLTVSRPEHP